MDTSVYDSKEYRRSRWAYGIECTFEYFVMLLVGDAFLAKLLTSMGVPDATVGIIASMVSLAFLFQLVSVFVVQRIRNTKCFAVLFHSLGQLTFSFLYVIPFLPFAESFRAPLALICILLAYFGNYFVHSIIFQWGNSYVDPKKRGSFSAVKEMISLFTGIFMTLLLGYIMDVYEANDNLEGSFIFASVAIVIFALCDLVCLLMVKNQVKTQKEIEERVPMRVVMRETLGNKNFVRVMILDILWKVALYATSGFLGTFRIRDLAFTVGAVQVINIAGSMSRFLLSRPMGRFSDKHSFAKGVELGILFAAIGYLFVIGSTPATRYLIIGYSLFHGMSMAGVNANMSNIVYSYVDTRYFVQASAIKNSISGLCGFGASLAASRLLAYVQENGNRFLGLPVYGQQVLAAISLTLLGVALLYAHFVIGKQKVMIQ